MNCKRTVLLILLLLIPATVFSQTGLINRDVERQMLLEISGIRAKDHVISISQYNRTDGAYENTSYEKAINYVMSVLNEAGVEDVELLKYLSDGTKRYGSWRSNPGFRVKKAKLYQVKPRPSKWCDYSRTPVSLMPYSNGKGAYEGEVVYAGRGTSARDYEGKEVKGKIVFVDRGNVTAVMREAVIKRGALGILSAFSGSRAKSAYPKLVEVNRLYVTGEEMAKCSWGFSLNKEQTDGLKRMLNSGRQVIMKAEVDAETFSGNMGIISAAVKGSKYPDQEIIYMAHLDHYKPGANDNASGSAGILEIAATLTKMINEGRIPRPLRTMRFIWLPEQQGTAAYLVNNMDTAKKGVIGINLDMIGEDYEKCSTCLIITRTPFSQPSFLDALMDHYANYIDRLNITTRIGSNNKFNFRFIDYMGESDHAMFNDAGIGVPSTMVVHLTDKFWHTSLDTPDKVDPTELERSIFLGLFAGWAAANYERNQINDLVELTQHNIQKVIEDYSLRYISYLKNAKDSDIHKKHRDIKKYYDVLNKYGAESIGSVLENVNTTDRISVKENVKLLNSYIELYKERATIYYNKQCSERGLKLTAPVLSNIEKECSKIVPERLIELSLSIDIYRQLPRVAGYDVIWEMINFTDGENSILDIRNAVSAQFREISAAKVKSVFDKLNELNAVKF